MAEETDHKNTLPTLDPNDHYLNGDLRKADLNTNEESGRKGM